jgi:hypothetical protein
MPIFQNVLEKRNILSGIKMKKDGSTHVRKSPYDQSVLEIGIQLDICIESASLSYATQHMEKS